MARNFPASTASYINLGDIAGVDFARLTAWSWLSFFRVENTDGDDRCIFSKFGSSTDRVFKLQTDVEAAPASLEFFFNTTVESRTGNIIGLDTWYLVAITNNGGGGAGDMIYYVFEMDLTEVLNSSRTHPGDPGGTSTPMTIGVDNGEGSASDPFDGDIAHVAYMDRALTIQEVKSYARDPGRSVMQWRAAGDQVFFYHDLPGESPEPDRSGSGNDGTLNGSTTIGDNPPVPVFPASGGLSSFPVAAAGDGGDPERKRRSVAATGRRWRGPVILPDGSISQGDRYAIGRNYWREAAAAEQGEAKARGVARSKGEATRIRGAEAKPRSSTRAQGLGSKIAAGQARAVSSTRAGAVGSKRAAGQAKARGVSRAHAIGTRIRGGVAQGTSSTRAHGEALRIRTSEAKGRSSTRAHAEAERIRLAQAKARSATRAKGEGRKTAAGQAHARGIARSKAIPTSKVFGEAHARSSSRSKGVGRKIAGGQARALSSTRSHGEGRKTASGQGKARSSTRTNAEAIRVQRGEAKARSSTRAHGDGSKRTGATAFARGVTRAHGEGRATRAGVAKARSSTRAHGEARATLRGQAKARGIARARGQTPLFVPPLAKARGVSRAHAIGRKIARGPARARGISSAFGILTRFEWDYELIRGETRYAFSTAFVPRDVDTEVRVARRNRRSQEDFRTAQMDGRAWPPFRCQFRILEPLVGRWENFDLTGVDRIVFTLTDLHGNRVFESYGAAVGDPTSGVAEFDAIPFREVLAPGQRLGRWRVDKKANHEAPIFFPLKREIPLEVLS